MGPAETALEEMGERPRSSEPAPVPALAAGQSGEADLSLDQPVAGRVRAARPAVRRAPRTRKSPDGSGAEAADKGESSVE